MEIGLSTKRKLDFVQDTLLDLMMIHPKQINRMLAIILS